MTASPSRPPIPIDSKPVQSISIVCFDGTTLDFPLSDITTNSSLYKKVSTLSPLKSFALLTLLAPLRVKSEPSVRSLRAYSYYYALSRSSLYESSAPVHIPNTSDHFEFSNSSVFLVPISPLSSISSNFHLSSLLPSPEISLLPTSFTTNSVKELLIDGFHSNFEPIFSFSSQLFQWSQGVTSLTSSSCAKLRRSLSCIVNQIRLLRIDTLSLLNFISDLIVNLQKHYDDLLNISVKSLQEYENLKELTVPRDLEQKFGHQTLEKLVFNPLKIVEKAKALVDQSNQLLNSISAKLRLISSRLKDFNNHFDFWNSSITQNSIKFDCEGIPLINFCESINSLHFLSFYFSSIKEEENDLFSELKNIAQNLGESLKIENLSFADCSKLMDILRGDHLIVLINHFFELIAKRAHFCADSIQSCNQSFLIHSQALEGFSYSIPNIGPNISNLKLEIQNSEIILSNFRRFVIDSLDSLIVDSFNRGIVNWYGVLKDLAFSISDSKKAVMKISKSITSLLEFKKQLEAVLNLKNNLLKQVNEIDRRRKADETIKNDCDRVQKEIVHKQQEEEIYRRNFDAQLNLEGLALN
ncbi:hypothetical protein RCL1_000291 [Eukaryota sp. TZLM3-RCL]